MKLLTTLKCTDLVHIKYMYNCFMIEAQKPKHLSLDDEDKLL